MTNGLQRAKQAGAAGRRLVKDNGPQIDAALIYLKAVYRLTLFAAAVVILYKATME
jgi:hypothetical protein